MIERPIYAIDPGTDESAWVKIENEMPVEFAIEKNYDLAFRCIEWKGVVLIEKIESFGMRVGESVFKTVWWTGRFHQILSGGCEIEYISRREVKMHLLNSTRGTDKMIRDSLIERYGQPGIKSSPGALYGLKSHLYSALALGVVYIEQKKLEKLNIPTIKSVMVGR